MVDGRVARRNNQVTVFGSFFDSVIDRYSDVVLFFGLLVYYGRINRFRYVVLVAFVMVTSLMVSYTRARAEALIGSCKVGFMERPERIVLILLGALFEQLGRDGAGAVGAGGALDDHGDSPHPVHLPEHQASGAAEPVRARSAGHHCYAEQPGLVGFHWTRKLVTEFASMRRMASNSPLFWL